MDLVRLGLRQQRICNAVLYDEVWTLCSAVIKRALCRVFASANNERQANTALYCAHMNNDTSIWRTSPPRRWQTPSGLAQIQFACPVKPQRLCHPWHPVNVSVVQIRLYSSVSVLRYQPSEIFYPLGHYLIGWAISHSSCFSCKSHT